MTNTRVTIIGSSGFVGSAFCRLLRTIPHVHLVAVDRAGYEQQRGQRSAITIDCAGNSRKYLAEEQPRQDFAATVEHRLRTLEDFPADLQLHVSSVDVYDRLDAPQANEEDCELALPAPSHYGFHKRLAEEIVRQYAKSWLILRLAGMVGEGLRKNPVFDAMSGRPLWIHPESRYQFLNTDDVARIAWHLASKGVSSEVFNVCGRGLVTPRDIAKMAGRELDLSRIDPTAVPRIVDVSVEKLALLLEVPDTHETLRSFIASTAGSLGRHGRNSHP